MCIQHIQHVTSFSLQLRAVTSTGIEGNTTTRTKRVDPRRKSHEHFARQNFLFFFFFNDGYSSCLTLSTANHFRDLCSYSNACQSAMVIYEKTKKLNPFVRTLMFQPQNCSNLRRAPSCLFLARRQKPAWPLTLVHAWSTLARDRSWWQASPSAWNRLTSRVSGVWISFFRFVSHHIVYIAQKEKKKWPERRICCLSASATKIKQPDVQGGLFF